MTEMYSIHVVPDETTEGASCYLAYHPELPGCMNHGATVGEAIDGLHAARELYLKTLEEIGQPIPPSSGNTVVVWENFPVVAAAVPSLPTTELTAHR